MIIGAVLGVVLVTAVVVSVALLVRDMRRLHRSGKKLVDKTMDADGMSAAGMGFIDSYGTH